MTKQHMRGPQQLKHIMPIATKPVFTKRHRVEAQIMTEWSDIVGKHLARITTPLKLTFNRNKGTKAGTLKMAVHAPFAMEVQYQVPLICEYISHYIGYEVVAQIQLVQREIAVTNTDEKRVSNVGDVPVIDIEGIDDPAYPKLYRNMVKGLPKEISISMLDNINKKRGSVMRYIILSLFLVLLMPYAAVSADDSKKEDDSYKYKVTDSMPFDVVYGSDDAPLTVYEYASLSCSHCASFHNAVFEAVKMDYIDTGKVKFVYRHFPLNQSALRAAMLVNCAPEDKQKDFINVLFKTQSDWAYSRDFESKLKNIAKLGGIHESDFDQCMSNASAEEELLKYRLKTASDLEVTSTPTFFFGETRYEEEDRKRETFIKALDEALAEK